MKNDVKQRCTRCLMPNSFPGISFDDEGVCNQCLNYKKIEPLGEDLLLKTLKSRKGVKYDCIVGISGGKDSCYVAYLAKEIYKLRTLAVFYESPFYCSLARENVNNVYRKLNIDLEIVNSKNNLEYKLLRNHLMSVGATGVTIHYMDEKVDSGEIIIQEKIYIEPGDDMLSLKKKSIEVGAKLVVKAVELIEKGKAPRMKQDEEQASYYSYSCRVY